METRVKYKYEAIADEIQAMINDGQFPDGLLPAEAEFIKRFKVGKITVYNALKKLTDEKVIVRIKRKGTFVNKREFLPTSKSLGAQCIPLLMPDAGHFFGDIYGHINRQLLQAGFIPASFNYHPIDKIADNTRLIQLLKSGIKGIIIYGSGYWRHRIMDNFPQVKSVFIDFYDADGKPPYGAVFIDYETAAFETTRKLIKSGKKNIMIFRHMLKKQIKSKPEHLQNHVAFQMESGFNRAMSKYGGNQPTILEIVPEKANDIAYIQGIIRELLSAPDRPDAIMCSYDALAVKVVMQAMLMQINIPDELAVTGFYNTPWSEECPLPLSSISIDKEAIAKEAVNMIISGHFPKEPIIIKPRLKERCTT